MTPDSTSLNPFRLWRRSRQWRGRFTGRQLFAVIVTMGLAGLGLPLLVVASGWADPDRTDSVGALALRGFFMAWGAFSIVVIAGALVRRPHDLGLGAWLGVLALVPGLNVVFLLYLLFAPGNDGAAGRAPFSLSALGKSAAAVMLCGLPVALSCPGVMRSRAAANEGAAIGDLRAIVSAQGAYQAINGGEWEGQWDCLTQPAACLPDYTGPSLLDPAALESPRMGYGAHE